MTRWPKRLPFRCGLNPQCECRTSIAALKPIVVKDAALYEHLTDVLTTEDQWETEAHRSSDQLEERAG